MIDKDYERMKYLDNFFLRLEFNSIEINCIKKKSEYFENIINSLKNTMINLGNPYNYNLWRKLSNIILKNLLVILSKKKYKFLQYKNKTVLSNLKYYESKLKKTQLLDFQDKIKKYEENLENQEQNISFKGTSLADRKRNYNIIVVENQIKYSLIIGFLFFLKEKDNKINHFDEEVIDLILFDDLNININMDEEPKEKGKNYSQQKNKTQLKSSFNSEEIIDMLKNPFKYHKKDINIDKIYSAIYQKQKEFKTKIGYMENNIEFNDLKNTYSKIFKH